MRYILCVPHLLLGLKTADLCLVCSLFSFIFFTFIICDFFFPQLSLLSLAVCLTPSNFLLLLLLQGHCHPSNKQHTFLVMVAPEKERESACTRGQTPCQTPLSTPCGGSGFRKGVCVCVCLFVTEVVQMLLQSLRPACCICKMTNHTYHLGGIIKKLCSLRRVFEREAVLFIHPQGGFQVQPVFAYISERSII